MNLSQFLLILRARFKIIFLVLSATVITALAVSLVIPKKYKAVTTLVVNYKGTDPVTGFSLPAQLMLGYMATQVDIAKSMHVALQVVDDLKLTENTERHEDYLSATKGKGTYREWLATQMLKYLEVAPGRESSMLNIEFSHSDSQFAATAANAFAHAYLNASIRLKVDPSKQAAGYYNEQIRQLRDKFEEAQRNVTRYQEENGIVSADARYDIESARMSELSSQLVSIQGMLMEASSRRTQANGSRASESPDVVANPLVQNLKLQLAQAEARFSSVNQRVTEEHPQYQSAKAEVDRLSAALDHQIRTASSSLANNERILRRREADLREALEAQKMKVQEINRKRDQLKILTNEMESTQRSYEAATQRFVQNNFEGQSNQTNVALLNAATAPIFPASPKITLNVALSVVIGLMLGVGFALLAEWRDHRVRSIDDLLHGLQAPVLGVMVTGERATPPRIGRSRLLLPH